MLTPESVQNYISKCLGKDVHSILEIRELRDRSGREVLDCQYQVGVVIERRILKAYHKGCDDDSELGVANLARKAHLSSVELAARFIGVPKVFGSYLSDDLACILMERLEQTKWEAETRVAAAGILARLHNVPLDTLSNDLQKLITDSKPNRDRGRLGVIARSRFLDKNHPGWRVQYPELSRSAAAIVQSAEPQSSMTTLVHGDYFSVNLIPTAEGIYVIDWDLLALGDPMWDLGFLVGADAGISEKEVEEVISAYRCDRPIDEDVLHWQIACWRSLPELMRLMREYKEANS
jgi:aminoglycoside phosphotransferase (APT) family kinase protein